MASKSNIAVKNRHDERRVLSLLSDTYEQEGYSFYTHPPKSLLPKLVENIRPDALAIKDKEKVWIEVVQNKTADSTSRLKYIANIVSNLKGYSLRIVFTDDFSEPESLDFKKYSGVEIWEQLEHISELREDGYRKEAFVSLWILLEAICRSLVNDEINTTSVHSLNNVISALESEGFISFRDSKALRTYLQLRNRIVHGDLSVDVNLKQLTKLDGVARSLAAEID